MTEEVPNATSVVEKDGDTLILQPAGLEVPTEEFWEIWHALKAEHAAAWQDEYINKDRDYNAVQTRYLELHGMAKLADPFADEDGFVDAVR